MSLSTTIETFLEMFAWARKQKMPDVTFREFFEAPEEYPDAFQTLEELMLLMKMLKRLADELT